jgi:hypothetical protein
MKDKKLTSVKDMFSSVYIGKYYPLDIPNFSSKVSISHRYVTTSIIPINEIRKSK